MSKESFTDTERLVAERAVAMYREVQKAMAAAPHGQGLACTEAAVLKQGQVFLRSILEQAASAHEEAQKGGSAPGRACAERTPRSSTTRARC